MIADSYADSVRLLEATRAMLESDGVDWAWAVMATPANLETLASEGFAATDTDADTDDDGLGGAGVNDLVLALRADGEPAATAALEAGRWVLFEPAAQTWVDTEGAPRPQDLGEALAAAPNANVAIVSVPGGYAALEAQKALTRGLDVSAVQRQRAPRRRDRPEGPGPLRGQAGDGAGGRHRGAGRGGAGVLQPGGGRAGGGWWPRPAPGPRRR